MTIEAQCQVCSKWSVWDDFEYVKDDDDLGGYECPKCRAVFTQHEALIEYREVE